MRMNKHKMMLTLVLLVSAAGLPLQTRAAVPTTALTEKSFAQYHKDINPQPGESRWMEIAWFVDLHAARQKAATEGKPLFIYSSGGATGIGAC